MYISSIQFILMAVLIFNDFHSKYFNQLIPLLQVISVNVILSYYFFHSTIHVKIYTTYKLIDRFFLFLFKHFFVCHFQNFIWKFLHT